MMGISIAGLCRTASGEEARRFSIGRPSAINPDDHLGGISSAIIRWSASIHGPLKNEKKSNG
jgi:hypothetical protein